MGKTNNNFFSAGGFASLRGAGQRPQGANFNVDRVINNIVTECRNNASRERTARIIAADHYRYHLDRLVPEPYISLLAAALAAAYWPEARDQTDFSAHNLLAREILTIGSAIDQPISAPAGQAVIGGVRCSWSWYFNNMLADHPQLATLVAAGQEISDLCYQDRDRRLTDYSEQPGDHQVEQLLTAKIKEFRDRAAKLSDISTDQRAALDSALNGILVLTNSPDHGDLYWLMQLVMVKNQNAFGAVSLDGQSEVGQPWVAKVAEDSLNSWVLGGFKAEISDQRQQQILN